MKHIPILTQEILENLCTKEMHWIYDGTLGLGGHAQAILEEFPQIKGYLGTDLDLQHLKFTKNRLKTFDKKIFLQHSNFSNLKSILHKFFEQKKELNRNSGALIILLDLGICSNQLDDSTKGFAFSSDGPLQMTFDGSDQNHNCEKIIQQSSENKLFHIMKDYGEEPNAHKIAHAIIEKRKQKSLRTTFDLVEVIERNTHPKDRKKALARVFQAFRIAVNQEFEHLEKILQDSLKILQSGDRMGIITFHSLEDRIVKQFFVQNAKPKTKESIHSLHEIVAPAQLKIINKKPIIPSPSECKKNPRARSAKLRIIEKI